MPSLGLHWNDGAPRISGPILKIDPVKAKILLAQTLKVYSLRYHGASLYNMISSDLRLYVGTVPQFKSKLDIFLAQFPDCPHVDGKVTGITYMDGDLSNFLKDWFRVYDWSLRNSGDSPLIIML